MSCYAEDAWTVAQKWWGRRVREEETSLRKTDVFCYTEVLLTIVIFVLPFSHFSPTVTHRNCSCQTMNSSLTSLTVLHCGRVCISTVVMDIGQYYYYDYLSPTTRTRTKMMGTRDFSVGNKGMMIMPTRTTARVTNQDYWDCVNVYVRK